MSRHAAAGTPVVTSAVAMTSMPMGRGAGGRLGHGERPTHSQWNMEMKMRSPMADDDRRGGSRAIAETTSCAQSLAPPSERRSHRDDAAGVGPFRKTFRGQERDLTSGMRMGGLRCTEAHRQRSEAGSELRRPIGGESSSAAAFSSTFARHSSLTRRDGGDSYNSGPLP